MPFLGCCQIKPRHVWSRQSYKDDHCIGRQLFKVGPLFRGRSKLEFCAALWVSFYKSLCCWEIPLVLLLFLKILSVFQFTAKPGTTCSQGSAGAINTYLSEPWWDWKMSCCSWVWLCVSHSKTWLKLAEAAPQVPGDVQISSHWLLASSQGRQSRSHLLTLTRDSGVSQGLQSKFIPEDSLG